MTNFTANESWPWLTRRHDADGNVRQDAWSDNVDVVAKAKWISEAAGVARVELAVAFEGGQAVPFTRPATGRANTTTVRYHSSDDMDGLGELSDVTEPVAVVIRPGGSVDVYGCVAVIDQRPA